MSEQLEVWLDTDFVDTRTRVGTLSHDRGQVWFNYDEDWLKTATCFVLDPSLTLDSGRFFPKPETGNFGIFLDSSPDRWGQMLMDRREVLEAKDNNRVARKLYAWDYLIGVQDATRQGALRFCLPGKDVEFLASDKLSAPPVTSLSELETIARELSSKRVHDLDALRKWLAVLVAPGASLGGARPKANFLESDGSLWIAKFPSRYDEMDVAAWEMVTHTLARKAGLNVPPAKLLQFKSDHHTFCVQRFDRKDSQRVFYASAMTLLNRSDSENASYLDLAQIIQKRCDKDKVDADLAQLFRRVVFNVAVSNRDDHLRNHGFLMTANGWTLAPAFDLNPNLEKNEHVLNIDDRDNRPRMETVVETAEFYGLNVVQANEIVGEVLAVVEDWRAVAKLSRLSEAEIWQMESAFDLNLQQEARRESHRA